MKMGYQEINADTVNRWVEDGWEWGKPISHEEYLKAEDGEWNIFLTPTRAVPKAWLEGLKGKDVLGLASGGGQQMPVFAAMGAKCTVLDYSGRQIETEKQTAIREGYAIRTLQADMTKPLPFEDESFDFIFHPVSNCYVREVKPIFRECFRVLKKGGILLAGLNTVMNYIVDDAEERIINSLPFDPLADEEQMKQLRDADCGVQFSHTLEEQIGGQLEAGFILTDIYEDTNGEGRLHEMHIPAYIATRAVKKC
jgi:SAM-dependent methyltransferase